MGGLRLTLCLLGLITYAIPFSVGIPEACLTVYNQGGASAALQLLLSFKISNWILLLSTGSKPTCESTKPLILESIENRGSEKNTITAWFFPSPNSTQLHLSNSTPKMEPSSNIKLEMGGLRLTLCLLGLITYAIPFSVGMPEACLTVYNQGGASAVLQSPECSLWIESIQSVHKRTTNCHCTANQGAIKFLDQDVLCNLDMTIPLPGKYGTEEVRVWAAAVFDGHAGAEASEMASKLLLDYFLLHSMFISINPNTEGYIMVNEGQNKEARQEQHDVSLLSYGELPDISKQSRQRRIFEDVLVRSVNDIDSTFSKEAFVKNFTSGAVGTVVVWVDGHLLVANVGNLEATFCSENLQSHEVVEGHSPNRVDEGEWFVTAGAHVFKWKVSYWADVIISITRAIIRGFVESAGVVSKPEVTDSKPLTANDTRFVVARNSIFERLPPLKIILSETEKQELLSIINQRL